MKFETTFSIGDKAWAMGWDRPEQVTIGQIRIEYTDSQGSPDGHYDADNYKPQHGYKEQYMCEETGIVSGQVYTLNEHIFATEAECAAKYAVEMALQAEEKRQFEQRERERKLRKEASLREQLAEIERIKAEGV